MVRRYWTAAATKFYEEQRAAQHVERQGFPYYLPQMLTRRGDGFKKEYLFPGYIFIRINKGWESLMNTRGIRRLFMCGGMPTRMLDSDIDCIKARENESGLIELEPRVAVGSRVLVQSGAFKDLLGTVEHMSAGDRCRVLVSMMERVISVEMRSSIVRVA